MIGDQVDVGSAHGRFQPFHNGHLEYVLAAKERCEFLWVGITNYDISQIEAKPLGRHRERPENNPLTYFERINIIRDALMDAGVKGNSFGFVPFPIETPNRLPGFMPLSIPCFTTICEEWNRHKITVLRALGYQVLVLWERLEKTIEGGVIRQKLIQGDESWRQMVPAATAKAADRLQLDNRLKELTKTGGIKG